LESYQNHIRDAGVIAVITPASLIRQSQINCVTPTFMLLMHFYTHHTDHQGIHHCLKSADHKHHSGNPKPDMGKASE